MGYRIIASLQQVEFTSKTRAGLNEEIDRFIKEKRPGSLQAVSTELVPSYLQRTVKDEPQWYLSMWLG